jgi:hypothetical protein
LLLTVALTYPQVRWLDSHVGDHYDALLSVWRLAWVAYALREQPWQLFDANIFWPERAAIAYTDAMLLPGLVGAPLAWAGVAPVPAHNVLLLSSYVASGVAMYVLVRELTGSRAGAWFGGLVFAFIPYRLGHYNQLELMSSWPIPLAFWALHRLVVTGRKRHGAWLGAFVVAQALSSVYYLVFLVTALSLLAPLIIIGRRDPPRLWSSVSGLMMAGVLAAALVLPYGAVYRQTSAIVGLRSEQEMRDFSATWGSYASTAPQNWLYGRRLPAVSSEMYLFPGIAALVAAVIGLWPPLDRTRVAYGVLLIVAVDLSLGAYGLGYTTLFRNVSLYRGLRVPARMFVIASAALGVLGGFGVARLGTLVRARAARIAAATLLPAVFVIESVSPPDLQPVDRIPRIYRWLARQPPSVVLEWPLPRASGLGGTHDPIFMYYSTRHWQTLLNGYGGFWPPSYILLLETMPAFPSRRTVDLLHERSVDFVILHKKFDPVRYGRLQRALIDHEEFTLILTEGPREREISMFRVSPASRAVAR